MAELCCRERRFDVVSRRERHAARIVVAGMDVVIAMTAVDVIVEGAGTVAVMIVEETIVEEAETARRAVSSVRARSRRWIRRRQCCRA
jgi:hypothetical protein